MAKLAQVTPFNEDVQQISFGENIRNIAQAKCDA